MVNLGNSSLFEGSRQAGLAEIGRQFLVEVLDKGSALWYSLVSCQTGRWLPLDSSGLCRFPKLGLCREDAALATIRPDLTEYLSPLPERPTVIESLTKQILSLIKHVGLRPGDKLPSEKEIMSATNASRPSVREALRALKTMGVIETRPGAGSFVKSVELASLIKSEVISLVLMGESLRDMLDARMVLECEVARRAAQRDSSELVHLEGVLDDIRAQVESGQDLYESTWAFHMAIAEVAGNPVMAKLVHILYEMITEVELTFYWPVVDPWEELENHEKLYRAILKGEEEAQVVMRDHLERVADVVEQAIENEASASGLV